jgi:hypothetical protein
MAFKKLRFMDFLVEGYRSPQRNGLRSNEIIAPPVRREGPINGWTCGHFDLHRS